MSLSVLATYDNSITAHLLKAKLEHEGIPCFLNNENFSTLMPHFFNILGSGVQVLVPTRQLKQARKIAKFDDEHLYCPNCGSSHILNSHERPGKKVKSALVALFFAVPIGNLLNDYICRDCRHQFKK